MRPSAPEPVAGCWKTRDGVCQCDGSALRYEAILNIPVVLVIEIGDINTSSHWDIPQSLYPLPSNAAASAHRVKYSITSHLYCSPDTLHFTARYLSCHGGQNHIFDYDGMKNAGHSVRRPTKTLKGSLTGPSNLLVGIPEGYFLYAAVYHLDGGEEAQKYFRKEQIPRANKLGLHFTQNHGSLIDLPSACEVCRPDLSVLSDEDRRAWYPQGNKATIDYVISPPPKSPKKGAQKSNGPIARARSSSSTTVSISPLPSLLEDDSDDDEPRKRQYSLPPIAVIPSEPGVDNGSDDESRNTRLDDWYPGTKWFPAVFVNFDAARIGREYQFQWVEEIVWEEKVSVERTFYRSVAHFESVFYAARVPEEQVGIVRLPICFKAVPEDADDLVPALAHIFALAALDTHALMLIDPNRHAKAHGPGSILLQLLAIQHSLGDDWDLNGSTFSDIQAGHIVLINSRGADALEAMWECIDPIYLRIEESRTLDRMDVFEADFKEAHAIYEMSTEVVFYQRLRDSGTPDLRPSIPITHRWNSVLRSKDLPPAPPKVPKRIFVDSSDDEEPAGKKRKKSKGVKWAPKPTPPHVRRSGRLKDKVKP
ncbi:hypothetical protein C8R43DRAFT_1131342 [Mycena crocata]|nr:hypothetical protein C8R43DRAFT_1131342 [Mycena crocata]